LATHTAADVDRRGIATDRARVADPGAFGIRPEPAAAIVRQYGGQTRRAPRRGRVPKGWCDRRYVFVQQRRFAADSSFGMCQERVTAASSANGSNRP
jgi:hypothetical protein